MSEKDTQVTKEGGAKFGSTFGYIMVAAGAAVGLGNVWKFPYLCYENGGGAFMIAFVVVGLLVAYPMVKVETCIGRFGGGDAVSCYEKINPKWGFIGWIANLCTLLINMFYVVVGGWVLKYAVHYIISGDFSAGTEVFFTNFTTAPIEPLIWSTILLAFVSIFLLFGITGTVEKMLKVMMPALFIFLIICGIWACIAIPGATAGLSFYFIPDFSQFTFTTFGAVCTQVLFSVGIGWGIFTTLGANVPKGNNVSRDSILIVLCDALVAIVAGFVVIPSALAFGTDLAAGPRLVFEVMAGVFAMLPGGRILGALFFVALLFAVISSLFTFFEIGMRTFEIKLGLGRKKGVLVVALIILAGNILVSLGFGMLSWVQLPWPSFGGLEHYGFYDWIDCFTAYVLLPLGVLLTALFVVKGWGFVKYEQEMVQGGAKPLGKFEKFLIIVVVPIAMIMVLLYVFGVLH